MRTLIYAILLALLAQPVWASIYVFRSDTFVERSVCLEALELGRPFFKNGDYEYVIFEGEIFQFRIYGGDDKAGLRIFCRTPTKKY